jgi:hypothetical protein
MEMYDAINKILHVALIVAFKAGNQVTKEGIISACGNCDNTTTVRKTIELIPKISIR